ncbi:MAG: cyclic nucleotide-binding domain-containing protein [Chloroflexota bacterium]|nr:cyclic nucleotide-binding domain-containing protein [Chloroflexota bacterium]
MILLKLIRNVELFNGLTDTELKKIAELCQVKQLKKGETLIKEGDTGDEFFIISKGAVEVIVNSSQSSPETIINLGAGQLIGEMSLVQSGTRSATVRALHDNTTVHAIHHDDFHQLCESDARIGYIIMRNMAADISFKLRHFNLSRN